MVNNLTDLVNYIDEFTAPENLEDITYDELFTGFKLNAASSLNASGLTGQQLKAAHNKLVKLIKAYQDYIRSRETILTPDQQSYSWGDIVKQYFLSDWGLSKDDLIDGFVVLANEEEESFNVGELKEALDVILNKPTRDALLGPGGKKILSAIIGTIHSVLYQNFENFKVMLLVNYSIFRL